VFHEIFATLRHQPMATLEERFAMVGGGTSIHAPRNRASKPPGTFSDRRIPLETGPTMQAMA
jgi:hypothetical protein